MSELCNACLNFLLKKYCPHCFVLCMCSFCFCCARVSRVVDVDNLPSVALFHGLWLKSSWYYENSPSTNFVGVSSY